MGVSLEFYERLSSPSGYYCSDRKGSDLGWGRLETQRHPQRLSIASEVQGFWSIAAMKLFHFAFLRSLGLSLF